MELDATMFTCQGMRKNISIENWMLWIIVSRYSTCGWRGPTLKLINYAKCMQVLLHDREKVPSLRSSGILISPGLITKIAVDAEYVSFRCCWNMMNFYFIITQRCEILKTCTVYLLTDWRLKFVFTTLTYLTVQRTLQLTFYFVGLQLDALTSI